MARAASITPMPGAMAAIMSETRTSALRPASTLRRSSRAEQRVSSGAATAAATAGTTTISPPVPIETRRCPLISASSPTGITSENTSANDPSAMATTAGQALRSRAGARAPMRQASCAGTTRATTVPLRARVTGPAGLVAWPRPAVTAPVPRLARSRVALSHVQAPQAGDHVSRPRRAGHLLLGKLRDISRNCQRDMSRNSRPACPVA
jgi:hypothetical protein